MKIAILNESFLTESHIKRLKQLGEVIIYESTNSEEKAIERLQDIDIAVMDGFICPLNQKVVTSSNQLKLIVLNHSGFEMVDMESANNKGIKVADASGYSTEGVAEHAIALMFAVIRHIPHADREMRNHPFQIDPANKEQQKYLGFNVAGKTLGVIGLGSIGSRVAELGNALGMKVVGYNRTPKNVPKISIVSLEELLKTSDVISINIALAPELEHIIGENELSLMKSSAVLINTAVGKHVDNQALYSALKEGRIRGAGLDVLEDWTENNPLLKLDNVVITPHEAFFTTESLKNVADIITKNIETYVAANSKNSVG
jgi:lactate dehydrogenase-like 2-hydroxyacid dehydrogenase